MKVFHGSWNAPETVFHEMLWKKNSTMYPFLNRMLLDAAKFQGYSFQRFWVIKEKPTGGVKSPPPRQPRLVLKGSYTQIKFSSK